MVGIVVVTRAALLIARRASTWTVDEHLAGLSPGCVAVDLNSPAQVYCGTARAGLFRSRDSGRNWEPVGRGIDHLMVTADWFPIPAAVAASEETGTRSSAVHLGRAVQVDRNTSGRQSGQVFVDRPGGGAPSDQQGRSGYDYDADHDSISSITPLGHTKHDLAVFLSSWRSRLTGRHPMNPW